MFHFNLKYGNKYNQIDKSHVEIRNSEDRLGIIKAMNKEINEIGICDNCLSKEDNWYAPGCFGFVYNF